MTNLRLRVDLTSTTGPSWLTLLALCGWLRGVVDIPEWFPDAEAPQLEIETVYPITEIGVENEHGQVVYMSREEWEGRQDGTWKTYPAHG